MSQQSSKFALPQQVFLRPPTDPLGGHSPIIPISPNTAESHPNLTRSLGAYSAYRSKPDSQSSTDLNTPAWTALATTSDEEDGLQSASQLTTPERDDRRLSKSNDRHLSRRKTQRVKQSPLKAAARGAFNPTQSFTIVHSREDEIPKTPGQPSTTMPLLWIPPPGPPSGPVAASQTSSAKRRPSQDSPESTETPQMKKRKHAPPRTTIRIPPMKPPSASTSIPPIKIIYSGFMARSGAQTSHSNNADTQDKGDRTDTTILPASLPIEAGGDVEKAGAPTRHDRLQTQPVIMDDMSTVEGKLVDDALDTHVSTIRVLPQYAHSHHSATGDVIGLHVALRAYATIGVDKGKRRAQSPWTVMRWSKAGEFKERLDSFYGPGDINRGLGKGPANIKRPSGDEDVFTTAPDGSVPFNQSDRVAASGTTLTEDEDDTDALLQGTRRGRLENPSPGKETRTEQQLVARSNTPEIV